jgi:predicted component of type VI protein secretion system
MEILLSIQSKNDGGVREVQSALDEGLVVGRGAEQGILLEGADLSREHFVLTQEGTTVYITDLSANGTWVNGKQIKKSAKTRVRPDDSIQVPGYVLTFRIVDQAQPPNPSAEPEPPRPSLVVSSAPPNLAAVVPQKQGPFALLHPVSQFVSSFTGMEKFMFLIALSGLILLYTYAAS